MQHLNSNRASDNFSVIKDAATLMIKVQVQIWIPHSISCILWPQVVVTLTGRGGGRGTLRPMTGRYVGHTHTVY